MQNLIVPLLLSKTSQIKFLHRTLTKLNHPNFYKCRFYIFLALCSSEAL